MRATLEIPDALIDDLLKVTGERTKTRAICLAIKDFIRRKRKEKLPSLSGKIRFDLDWKEMEEIELKGMKEREKLRNSRCTSVWVSFSRGIPAIKTIMEKLIIKDEVFTAGPILYELLQGIRSPEEKRQVKEALLSTNYLEITSNDWEVAATLASSLRAKGITLPMTDILIAHLGKTRNLEILSLDPHFDQIPEIMHRKVAI